MRRSSWSAVSLLSHFHPLTIHSSSLLPHMWIIHTHTYDASSAIWVIYYRRWSICSRLLLTLFSFNDSVLLWMTSHQCIVNTHQMLFPPLSSIHEYESHVFSPKGAETVKIIDHNWITLHSPQSIQPIQLILHQWVWRRYTILKWSCYSLPVHQWVAIVVYQLRKSLLAIIHARISDPFTWNKTGKCHPHYSSHAWACITSERTHLYSIEAAAVAWYVCKSTPFSVFSSFSLVFPLFDCLIHSHAQGWYIQLHSLSSNVRVRERFCTLHTFTVS